MEGIFLAGNRSLNTYRLGVARNIGRRLEEMRDEVPFELELVFTVPLARKLLFACLAYVRQRYAARRYRADWFFLSLDELERMAADVALWKKHKGMVPADIADEVARRLAEPKALGDLDAPPASQNLTFRFAEAQDSERFARWVAENPLIPQRDAMAGLKENNPTAVCMVIEQEGEPVLFAPVYCQMNVAYIGFNPEANPRARVAALRGLRNVCASFAWLHGVREVTVQSVPEYPVAKWALNNGFEQDRKETFRLRLSKGASA